MGRADGSVIVLDGLLGSSWDYWCLDPNGPPSAECGKWEVSPEVSKCTRCQKNVVLGKLSFGWGKSGEWRDGEGDQGLIIFCTFSPTYLTVNVCV